MAGRQNPPYDNATADRMDKYFRARAHGISNGAACMYLLGLRTLERFNGGLCSPVTANVDEFGEAACCDRKRATKYLKELEANGWGEYRPGCACPGSRLATRFRRFTLAELKEGGCKTLKPWAPQHAEALAAALRLRAFGYGDNPHTCPQWSVSYMGRVLSKVPNVQGDPATVRRDALARHVAPDRWVVYPDLCQAEPTILRHILAKEGLFNPSRWPDEPYNALAGQMGMARDDAKRILNALAYCREAARKARGEGVPEKSFAMDYARALDALKAKLWAEGKLGKTSTRIVTTPFGTRVKVGKPKHRGIVLNALAKATVADIVNPVSLDVIAREGAAGWRYLFPVHDGFYVDCPRREDADTLAAMLRDCAAEARLTMRAEHGIWPGTAGNVVPSADR